MSRQPRFILPGQPQHVIQRGNNRDVIFVSDDDYKFYLEKLQAACARFECELHAYVLMTNHVHLLLTPQTEGGIGKLVAIMFSILTINISGQVRSGKAGIKRPC